MSVQKIYTATLVGIDAALVEVEADISNGLPTTIIVGLPDVAVQESRERVRSAIKHSGFSYPQTRVSLNLAPSGLPKMGTHFDLPIALAILLGSGLLENQLTNTQQLFVGELSLDGQVKSVPGVLAMVDVAKKNGLKQVYVPTQNASMAALIQGIQVFPVGNLSELAAHINKKKLISPYSAITEELAQGVNNNIYETDFSNINGQTYAKRALEIAAAGGHNILMTGPPGSGKTLLAKAMPSILPPLVHEEILELTKIYNSAGKIATGKIDVRPFRSPHHTTSSSALIGGGNIPRPGEVTLAHHGVLFLDEFPEFSRQVLEVLRQPLEDNNITITRFRHTYTFPAKFILVAAQNPCPCGNFGQSLGNSQLECDCHPTQIQRYKKKISGPLLDRIDLHINVPRLSYDELYLNKINESSEIIRQRVSKARNLQTKRFGKLQTNNQMSLEQIKRYCILDSQSEDLLKNAAEQYQLSGRTIHRVHKVARTIADLSNCEQIQFDHLAESLQYRLRD